MWLKRWHPSKSDGIRILLQRLWLMVYRTEQIALAQGHNADDGESTGRRSDDGHCAAAAWRRLFCFPPCFRLSIGGRDLLGSARAARFCGLGRWCGLRPTVVHAVELHEWIALGRLIAGRARRHRCVADGRRRADGQLPSLEATLDYSLFLFRGWSRARRALRLLFCFEVLSWRFGSSGATSSSRSREGVAITALVTASPSSNGGEADDVVEEEEEVDGGASSSTGRP